MVFEVICVRPEHFAVNTQDNGYQAEGMRQWQSRPAYWKDRLLRAWDSAAEELTRHQGRLIQVPPHQHLPDQCFAADPVISVQQGDGARFVLPSRMNSPVRQQEVEPMLNVLQQHRFAVHPTSEKTAGLLHEGTGDFVKLDGYDIYLQGYGPRSQPGIGRHLTKLVNAPVVEVPLTVEGGGLGSSGLASQATRGFHADTLLWGQPNRYLTYCPERLHPATRQFVDWLYNDPWKRQPISGAEADLFITNGVAVPSAEHRQGHKLFIPKTTPQHIRQRFAQWGFGYKPFDFEPSKLAGGGFHCMFNFVLKVPNAKNAHEGAPWQHPARPYGALAQVRPQFERQGINFYGFD